MKTLYSCIVCIFCISCFAHAQVKDDFSDGNFTDNPVWTGDAAQFEINISKQLHLKAAGSDTSVLATRSSCVKNSEWSFWIKLSFNTSANNHARIYLAADTMDPRTVIKGYFVQVGGGDDSIYIMKQTATSAEKLYSFKTYRTLHSTNMLRFRIRCGNSGQWEAMVDTTGGYNYISDGTFFDDSFQVSRWFGLMCKYTSSNATKFYFDDFYAGPILRDTVPPVIISQEAVSARFLRVIYSEPVQRLSAETRGNYQLRSSGIMPDSVIQDIQHPEIVAMFLHDSLADGTTDSLRIRNITDVSENRMQDTVVPVCYYQPKAYDILIHEIMADPDPQVGLPNGEFVELYNRSMFPINLEDWTFKYGSYSKAFPAITLPSKGYLLIVKDSAYLNFAKCAVLFTSSSSLSNEGTTLVLKDPHHHVIHAVSYTPEWYRGSFKGEGGWSLEMTDPLNPCGCIENWVPSENVFGGTPGRANSTGKENPDLKLPSVLRGVVTDSASLEATFSESMDSISLLSRAGWVINHPDGETHPIGVVPVPPGFNAATLLFDRPFQRGITYTLSISGRSRDCAGNVCDSSRSIRFAIPDSVTVHDMVINEILSNPASGGSRFTELYNRSEKIIDLQSLVIANRDTAAGLLSNAMLLTKGGYLLFPGEYIAFTSSPEDIISRYQPMFPENVVWMNGFPVFGDDTGTVIIARKDDLKIIDKMRYNSDMHYPLLVSSEGVSLERTSPDLPSDDQNNWHSASETSGFATPGYQNSHRIVSEASDREIMIQPVVFSPDNDGRDDLLFVTIREADPDYAVNISVYDSRGRLVRQLANNILTGSEGVFTWDGMNAARSKAPLGFYILLVELTRPDGTARKIKKTIVLGGKL